MLIILCAVCTSVSAIVLIFQQGKFVCLTAQLYSKMFVASLILAVALTTARARTDNNFNISTGCLVRRGRCDSTDLTEWERASPTKIDSRNLQQCAFACKVHSIIG